MQHLESLKALARILANDVRRKIVIVLTDRPPTAAELARQLGISLPQTRYHLRKLKAYRCVQVQSGTRPPVYAPGHAVRRLETDEFLTLAFDTMEGEHQLSIHLPLEHVELRIRPKDR